MVQIWVADACCMPEQRGDCWGDSGIAHQLSFGLFSLQKGDPAIVSTGRHLWLRGGVGGHLNQLNNLQHYQALGPLFGFYLLLCSLGRRLDSYRDIERVGVHGFPLGRT